MSGDKVKLPHEVAKILDRLSETEPANWRRLVIVIVSNSSITIGGAENANLLRDFTHAHEGFMTLLQALVNGYEIEKTPEELIKEYYEQSVTESESGDHDLICCGHSKAEAIMFVLGKLKITIPGVNA